jgi:hypothetical protein
MEPYLKDQTPVTETKETDKGGKNDCTK